MKVGRLRSIDDRGRAALIGLVALSTLFAVEMTHVFVSYLVVTVDHGQWIWLGSSVVAAIALPIVTIVGVRGVGPSRLGTGSLAVLLSAWGLMAIIGQPAPRIVVAGLGLAAWWVLMTLLVAGRRRAAGLGFTLGLALNLALGILTRGGYLVWAPSISDLIGVLILLAVAAGLALVVEWPEQVAEPNLERCLPVAAIGPALALFHLVTGNLGLIQTHTGQGLTAAGGLLTLGLALGMAIALMRNYGLTTLPAGGLVALRFVAFDVLVGGLALWMLWTSADLRLLGAIFVTATWVELILLALFRGSSTQRAGLRWTAISFSAGMLLQVALLFSYYATAGLGMALVAAWLLLGGLAALAVWRGAFGQPFHLPSSIAPAVTVVVLILLANLAALLAAPAGPESRPLEDEIRVMTYNIHSGFAAGGRWDLPAIISTIEQEDPDVVMLQEVSHGWLTAGGVEQLAWLARELEMSAAWGPSSHDDLWGTAILTSAPIGDRFVRDLDSGDPLRSSAAGAQIETASGLLLAIGTHLPSDAPPEAVDQALETWDGHATSIVAGDFNAIPDSEVIERILVAGLVDASGQPPAGEAATRDGERVDYVFVSPDIEVLAARVIESDASDHRPVVVDLRLPDPREAKGHGSDAPWPFD